jgi:antirestriction protein ArdC
MEATPNLSAVHSPSKAVHSRTEASRQEALTRAISGQTMTNYPAIYQGFVAKGIPECEILPRENVFTFNAWRALGRTVRRGEHGVKVLTFIERAAKETDQHTGERKIVRLAWTTTVFHVSQTEAVQGGVR